MALIFQKLSLTLVVIAANDHATFTDFALKQLFKIHMLTGGSR